MLAVRRTLRLLRQSAARFAVVSAAGLAPHDAEQQVARGDRDAAGQRDLAVAEVLDRTPKAGAAAVTVHLPTIA